ncbi:MAG: nuclear transport factor 2 family protein [Gammaproteobacteria bacterium]
MSIFAAASGRRARLSLRGRVAVVLLALMAGAGTSVSAAAEPAKDPDLKVIETLYAAFEKGDVEAIVALMDDSVEWVAPGPAIIPFAGTFKGKEGIRRFFTMAVERLEVRDQKVTGFLSKRGLVAALGFEDMLVKSTGKTYRSNWVHLYTLRHGKIVKFEEFVDTAAQAAAFAQ